MVVGTPRPFGAHPAPGPGAIRRARRAGPPAVA